MHSFSLRFGSLLVFLLMLFQGQMRGEIADSKPIEISDILEQASKLTESINSEHFIEGCCIAQRWKLDTFVKIAAIQGKIKDDHGLERTTQRAILTAGGKSVYAYYLALLALAQAKTGDKTGMSAVAREALLAAREIKTTTARESVLEMIAQAEAEIGEIDKAMKIADEITDEMVKSNVIGNIAVNQKRTGDPKTLSITIERTLKLANSISEPGDRTFALRNIARTQAKIKYKKASIETLKLAKQSAESIADNKMKADALIGIAQVQMEIEDKDAAKETLKRALQVAHTINDATDQSYSLRNVSKGFLETGDRFLFDKTIQEALKVSDTVKDEYEKAGILQEIAYEYGEAKDPNDEQGVLERALTTAAGIEAEELKAYIFFNIATNQIKSGDLEGAANTINKIRDQTAVKPHALLELISAEAEAGNLEKAIIWMRTLDAKTNIDQRAEAMQKIAKARIKTSEIKAVISWANQLDTPYEKARALLGIAEGMLNR